VWLYFPAVRGDAQVSAGGKIIGVHKLPEDYQRKYSWAVEIPSWAVCGETEIRIDADMPGLPEKQDDFKRRGRNGKWFGLLLPPEIGIEDGGTRETPGRVSPPPDIFGPL
jgi:hypothetical protein